MTDKENKHSSKLDDSAAELLLKQQSQPNNLHVEAMSKSETQPTSMNEVSQISPDDKEEIPDEQTLFWRLRAGIWNWFRK